MDDVTVTPGTLEGFAATHAAIGAAVASAGAVNAAATTAAMVPVFGLIGQEFLGAFIGAQANHLLSVGNLAAVHAATAAGAVAGLAEFEAVDAANAATLRAGR
ncbi:type VII secretion target [Gordonia sp. VNQ95]|uniref:type VII secretion target n=1 Tax=Gordonia TaxID=2053 RepID=UPI0032B53D2B